MTKEELIKTVGGFGPFASDEAISFGRAFCFQLYEIVASVASRTRTGATDAEIEQAVAAISLAVGLHSRLSFPLAFWDLAFAVLDHCAYGPRGWRSDTFSDDFLSLRLGDEEIEILRSEARVIVRRMQTLALESEYQIVKLAKKLAK